MNLEFLVKYEKKKKTGVVELSKGQDFSFILPIREEKHTKPFRT